MWPKLLKKTTNDPQIVMKDNEKRIKIAYLTHRDALDKRAWSGTLHYMYKALGEHVGDVVLLGPYEPKRLLFVLKIFARAMGLFFKKKYNIAHSKTLAKAYGRYFTRRISDTSPDVIVAVASTPDAAYIKTNKPLVVVDDINFTLLRNYYSNFSGLFRFSIKESDKVIKRAYNKAHGVVFSSQWAKDSTVKDDGIPQEKIHVISYGANLEEFPSREEAIHKDYGEVCELLFLGVDWFRKGGNIAFEAMKMLNEQGFKARLTVCGCVPPEEFRHENMHVIPFLNKNNPEDFEKLYRLFLKTNFLIVPTRADCTPIVFCEANAFGLPVISTDTGGVSAVVESNVNGVLFQPESGGEAYANCIKDIYTDKEKYEQLVVSSRNTFENRLNWKSWAKEIEKILKSLLN